MKTVASGVIAFMVFQVVIFRLPIFNASDVKVMFNESVSETYQLHYEYNKQLLADANLEQAACKRAKFLKDNNLWSHEGFAGSFDEFTGDTFKTDRNKNGSLRGENLARGFVDFQTMFKAWLDSPTHKANIENAEYTAVGVCQYQDYIVVWFAE